MAEQKNTIVIGDVHGLTNWKKVVEKNHGSRFVFLGDYLDPYEDISAYDLIANLIEIMQFKTNNPDDVVLLLGNHDMHYIYKDFPMGTRYDDAVAPLIKKLFENNRELFQFAYQEGRTLYTHAGISNSWWKDDFMPLFNNESIPMKDGIMDVAQMLNNASKSQLKAMFQISFLRGGEDYNGGIFWADMYETAADPLKGFTQVVGHSRVESIQTFEPDADTQITFCDCLFNGEYFTKGE